jgi:hypothetical protein
MDWRFESGTARAAIYPVGPDDEPWVPGENRHDNFDPLPEWSPTEAQVMRIRGVEDVCSSGAQGTRVMVVADSIEELPAAVAHVREQLQRLFTRNWERHARRQVAATAT